MAIVIDGYWCEVMARSPGVGEWFLGGYWATTPRLAIRWLSAQATRLANALDPRRGHGSLPPDCLREVVSRCCPNPGWIFREWAGDVHYQQKQMDRLAQGRHISVNAGGPDRIFGLTDADTFYSLSARPISIPLTDWRFAESHSSAPGGQPPRGPANPAFS